MHIYLIRHGHYNPSYIDPNEGLSALGEEQVVQMADQIDHQIDTILSSPKTRAHQTATILAKLLNTPTITLSEALKPSSDSALAIALLKQPRNYLIVGHLPSIRQTAQCLTASPVGDFATATLVHIETDDPTHSTGRLHFHRTPS